MELNLSRYETETISHSGLNAFMISPRAFRAYKDGSDFNGSKSMDLGSAIHAYILEQETFYDTYLLNSGATPSPMYKKFVEELVGYDVLSIDQLTQKHYEDAYTTAGFKNPLLPKVIENFVQDKLGLKEYYHFLKSLTPGKIVLSEDDFTKVLLCTESMSNHKLASRLIIGLPFEESYVEKEILFEYPGFRFKMRAFLDKLIVDKTKKRVTIIDVKTTSKPVKDFAESFSLYGYHRQMYLYYIATQYWLKEQGYDPLSFTFEFKIVTLQTTPGYEVAVYTPTPSSLQIAKLAVEENLERLKWHFDNDLWDYPREYYEGDGSLPLDLIDTI